MADKKEKKETIGGFCRDLIRKGKDNATVLEETKKKFPEALTTLNSVNWYRNDLRKKGEPVPSASELRAKSKGKK